MDKDVFLRIPSAAWQALANSHSFRDDIEEALDQAEIINPQELIAQLQKACRLLVDAYIKGDAENCGSVDWSDLDQAYAVARDALGLTEQQEDAEELPDCSGCSVCDPAQP